MRRGWQNYTTEHGIWGGKAAEPLGLRGEVTRDDFLALTSNKIPGTEQTLTVRTKDNRTAGYDLCLSVHKSVSLYLAETEDRALERMIQEAFRETMADAENRMEARVRVGDQDDNRTVANMVYATFVHRETRPIRWDTRSALSYPRFRDEHGLRNSAFQHSMAKGPKNGYLSQESMSIKEILEELPKLTQEEKKQLWNALNHEVTYDVEEESPEILAAIDEGIRSLESGEKTYTIEEARQLVAETVAKARR
jgi:hypothetical protein